MVRAAHETDAITGPWAGVPGRAGRRYPVVHLSLGIALLTAIDVCFTPCRSSRSQLLRRRSRSRSMCCRATSVEPHCAVAQAVNLVQGQVAVLTRPAWPRR